MFAETKQNLYKQKSLISKVTRKLHSSHFNLTKNEESDTPYAEEDRYTKFFKKRRHEKLSRGPVINLKNESPTSEVKQSRFKEGSMHSSRYEVEEFYSTRKDESILIPKSASPQKKINATEKAVASIEKKERLARQDPARLLGRERTPSLQLMRTLQKMNNEMELFSENLSKNFEQQLKRTYEKVENYEKKGLKHKPKGSKFGKRQTPVGKFKRKIKIPEALRIGSDKKTKKRMGGHESHSELSESEESRNEEAFSKLIKKLKRRGVG